MHWLQTSCFLSRKLHIDGHATLRSALVHIHIKMFELISTAIVYLLFFFYLIKELLQADSFWFSSDVIKFLKILFTDFLESFRPNSDKFNFDSETDFKKVMVDVHQDFNRAYAIIRQHLLTNEIKDAQLADVVGWMDKVIDYNVPHGKRTRGLIAAASFKYFASANKLTAKNIELSCILGWCIEFLQASVLIIDDIMDHSIMRRGRRCWYLKEDVGMLAINDALLLQHYIFQILKHYFRHHKYYNEINELTRETSFETGLGQCIDLLTTPDGGRTDFSLLTDSRYATIVKYKTSLYTFDLPIRISLLFAGIKSEAIHKAAQRILIRMGHLFQAQDDFIDCFGDPEVTGKVGTDIEDGKCCWIAVEAVKRMNDEQIEMFKENYGNKDQESVSSIKLLYEQLDMKSVFKQFEESEYKEIRREIATKTASPSEAILRSSRHYLQTKQMKLRSID